MTRLFLATLSALGFAPPALAHIGQHAHDAFSAGFSHPLGGTDHLIAMLAVGVYASVLGGTARWSLPAGFVGGMTTGFLAALAGLPLPLVEPMILASVIALGLLLAFAVRPSTAFATAAVAFFGLFHGHAHGAEIGGTSVVAFGAGFVAGTAILHAAGVWLGSAMLRVRIMRVALGSATVAAGVALSFA
jgi:urease accessory protein